MNLVSWYGNCTYKVGIIPPTGGECLLSVRSVCSFPQHMKHYHIMVATCITQQVYRKQISYNWSRFHCNIKLHNSCFGENKANTTHDCRS